MERVDFYSVMKTIRAYISPDRSISQKKLMEAFFNSFSEDDNSQNFSFDQGQVWRWLNGQVKVSPKITAFYLQRESRVNDLAGDILVGVFPLVYDVVNMLKDLRKLVQMDPTISEERKSKLLEEDENLDEEDNRSLFVAKTLLFGMEREFVKRDPDTLEIVVTGEKSPKVTGYIFDDEIPKPCRYFSGRKDELTALHERLSGEDKVFVTGMAGIGKSEFVKAYAKNYASEYTNILYMVYRGNLKQLITDLDFADDEPFEDPDRKYMKHDRFLRRLEGDTLIIIDNFDKTAEEDPFLSEIMKYRCRILFTTRNRFFDYPEYELTEMKKTEDLLSFFSEFYLDPKNEKIIVGIIEQLHRHTFAVELAARLLRLGGITPQRLFKKLEQENIRLSSEDKIRTNKDGSAKRDTYYGHIHTLFGIYTLKDDAKYLLRCLSLVPVEGIGKRLFAFWAEEKNMNLIQTLTEIGFIHEIDESTIALYPMIQDVVDADLEPSVTNCGGFLSSIMEDAFIRFGDEYSANKAVIRVTERIIDHARVDDVNIYLTFLMAAFPFIGTYREYGLMDRIIAEMEKYDAEDHPWHKQVQIKLHEFKADRAVYAKDIHTTIEHMEQAVHLTENENDAREYLAILYMKLGSYYAADDQNELAEEYMGKGYALMEKKGFRPSQAHISMLCNVALLADEQGEYEKAIDLLTKSEQMYRDNDMTRTRAYANMNSILGQIYLKHDEEEKAKEHYQIAEKIHEELWEDMPAVADAMNAKMIYGILDIKNVE